MSDQRPVDEVNPLQPPDPSSDQPQVLPESFETTTEVVEGTSVDPVQPTSAPASAVPPVGVPPATASTVDSAMQGATSTPVSPGAPGAPGNPVTVGTPLAPDTPPPPAAKSTGFAKTVASAGAAALLLGGLGGYAGYSLAANNDPSATTTNNSASTIGNPENLSPRASDSITAIAEKTLPTVVSISSEGATESGTGSGFIVREDGYIVTNNHVVADAAEGGEVDVRFDDGESAIAEIVGRDPAYDIAVLKVDRTGLPVAALGDSGAMQVGDTVVAVGSPLGLSGTVTSGIISATERPVTAGGQGETSYINAIQTDAAINPGNSGGPLVNAASEVIGVNSAIATLGSDFSGVAGSIGLGFAIPSNTAKRIVEEIIETGQASTPIIGVNLDVNRGDTAGAVIGDVTPGSPAESAGLSAGEVIVAVNGRNIPDAVSLITSIRSFAPGDVVTLTVDAGGQTREVQVTLGSRDE
jgi:putative serine protease PepD